MTSPTGTQRALHYPLNRSADDVSDTPNDPPINDLTLDWITLDSDERVPVVMYLSLNEYVSLATSIDVGRDIAYGDNSLYIWWIWVRAVINFCEQMLTCIEDTEAIQQAIAFYGSGSNINGDSVEIATNLAGELVNDPMGCDNDIIYGMTYQLVEFSDRIIKDLFEQVKASNLMSNNVGYLINLIPVVETLPIDELFELGFKLANDMEIAYLSASTTLLKTEIACELFCLAQNNDCVLTLEMVRDYFEEKADATFSYDDVSSFLIDFVTGTFVGNAVYYACNVLFFQIFAFGGSFVGYFYEDYLRVINSMFNDPNGDWETDCDECGDTWEHVFDFTVDDGGFIARDIWGTGDCAIWTNGVGWSYANRSNGAAEYSRIVAIKQDIVDTEITSMSMTYTISTPIFNPGSLGNNICRQIAYFYGSSNISDIKTNMNAVTSGTDVTVTLTDTQTVDEVRMFLRVYNTTIANYIGNAVITSCTIQGNGTDPFV